MHRCRLLAIGLFALVASSSARAECLGQDAAQAARAFFEGHRYFHHDEPALIAGAASPRLRAALDREYRCAQEEQCALDADPWTAAQDGEMVEPITFRAQSVSPSAAVVAMSYTFTLGDTAGAPRSINLRLERSGADACWVVADLISPQGESLVEAIERWHATYGPAAPRP